MKKKMKSLADALSALFSGESYLQRVPSTRGDIDSIGEYQGPVRDKMNMSNDRRNICSDMNIAIKEGYGKIAAQ